MKKNYYSRKLRQFKNASKKLNFLLENQVENQFEIKGLIFKIKNLYQELKTIFSTGFIKKTIAGATLVLGAFFTNNATAQSFNAPVINPFGIQQEEYTVSKCAVNDFDADGDNDILYISYDSINNTRQFSYLRNTGTPSLPSFGSVLHNPFALDTIGFTLDGGDGIFGTPTAVDIDNDGDLDIMTGKGFDYYTTSRLIFAENIGSGTNPTYAPLELDPFGIAFADPYTLMTVPAFVDIDNDGDQDLFVGHYYGSLIYFQNIGTATNPNFTTEVENPFNIVTGANELSFPTFSDMDGDGDKDLLMGNYDGTSTFMFSYYQNIGTASAPNFAAPVINPFGLDQGTGYKLSSNLADMDGDGDKDLFTIFYYGNIEYYENTSGIGAGVEEALPHFSLNAYPNPAKEIISLNMEGQKSEVSKIEIIDVSGKVCFSTRGFVSEINIKNLDPGFYSLKVSDFTGKNKIVKIQKS